MERDTTFELDQTEGRDTTVKDRSNTVRIDTSWIGYPSKSCNPLDMVLANLGPSEKGMLTRLRDLLEREVSLRARDRGRVRVMDSDPTPTRAQFRRRRIITAMYFVVLVIALLAVVASVGLWWKLLASAVFLLLSPGLDDLFVSYDSYVAARRRLGRDEG